MIVLLMGVSGSGKTTVGKVLSHRIGWPFYDSDDFHPLANIEKLRSGIPLTDEDRLPWLEKIHEKMLELDEAGQSGIFGCSALKNSYRELLSAGIKNFFIVHLLGDKELIRTRVTTRQGHFMSPSLIDNQFNTLERPSDALELDVQKSAEEIADIIESALLEHT